MNRRDFLVGIAATAAITSAIPALSIEAPISAKVWYDQWLTDTTSIWVNFYENMLIYGTGAIKHIDEYPFIQSVSPKDLLIPELGGGLFQQA